MTSPGWVELESDPGLFTLLVQDFGVEGVEVQEFYDLQQHFQSSTFGFIFLYKYAESRRMRRFRMEKIGDEVEINDPAIVNEIFFAHQKIDGACATQALLSILLNRAEEGEFELGDTLKKFHELTRGMTPEHKGYAIANFPDLAYFHNRHARPDAIRYADLVESRGTVATGSSIAPIMDQFHFTSFVPINGRLYELDGLRSSPIDHGEVQTESWTEKFRAVVNDYIEKMKEILSEDEIRYNLMAVVPCKAVKLKENLSLLQHNLALLQETLDKMSETEPEEENMLAANAILCAQLPNVSSAEKKREEVLINEIVPEENSELFCAISSNFISDWQFLDGSLRIRFVKTSSEFLLKKPQIKSIIAAIMKRIQEKERLLNDEQRKLRNYRIEDQRRTHDYDPFIRTFLHLLLEQGIVDQSGNLIQPKSKPAVGGGSGMKVAQNRYHPYSNATGT